MPNASVFSLPSLYHPPVRVLLITDQHFVTRERAMIRRLLVGLADEGVYAQIAVPAAVAPDLELDVVAPVVPFEAAGSVFSRPLRAERLVERSKLSSPDRAIDIVHVLGGSAWTLAAAVAQRLGAIAVFEVWRAGLTERARAMRIAAEHAVAFFTPSPGIERALLREGAGLIARLTPWGVHVPAKANPVLREGRPPSIVLAGGGRAGASFVTAFRGVCDVLSRHHDAMLFVDADAAGRNNLYRLTREASLLDRVSFIDAVEERRELVVRNDILLYPEHRGEQRTFLLDAMGAGMAVIAHADPLVAALLPDQTARVLDNPTSELWASELQRLLEDPPKARTLGLSARDRIRSEYRATTHIRSVLDGYEWLTSADAMPFRENARS